MKQVPFKVLAITTLAVAAGGCATHRDLDDTQKLALYRSHAGEAVTSFQYYGSINGWTPIGDDALAVWTRPNQAWLLELTGRCQDLPYTPAITITNQMGRVSSRFDKVITTGRGSMYVPCHIREIRPLDVKAIKQAEKTARGQPASPDQPPAAPSSEGT